MGSTTSRRLSNKRAQLAERKKRKKRQPPINDTIVFAEKKVSHAGHQQGYSVVYDSFYCLTCNVWKENRCGEPDTCTYCKDRPATPQDAIESGALMHDED